MSDRTSDGASEGSLPRALRWPHIASVIVGATLGGMLGLVFFGYPPARIVLPDDEPGRCGHPDEHAVALATALDHPPSSPAADFHADRCGEGLRAWGAPLRPEARSQWMEQVTDALHGEPMERVLTDWRDEHQRLTRQQHQLTDAIAQEQQRLQAELAAVGLRSAISVLDEAIPVIDAEEVVGLAFGVNELRAERERIDEKQQALAVDLRYAQQVRDHAAVLPPTTGVFSATLGAILGGLAVLILLTGMRLLRARPRAAPPEQP